MDPLNGLVNAPAFRPPWGHIKSIFAQSHIEQREIVGTVGAFPYDRLPTNLYGYLVQAWAIRGQMRIRSQNL